MRTPTEAEIDAIPVSDEEVEQHVAKLDQIGRALNKAGIPATLDWVMTVLAVASQALVIVGMPREYFLRVARACWETTEGLPRQGLAVTVMHLDDMQQRVMRVMVALRRERITLDAETVMLLLHHTARQLYYGGVEEDAFIEVAEKAYDHAVERVRVTAKRKGSA